MTNLAKGGLQTAEGLVNIERCITSDAAKLIKLMIILKRMLLKLQQDSKKKDEYSIAGDKLE